MWTPKSQMINYNSFCGTRKATNHPFTRKSSSTWFLSSSMYLLSKSLESVWNNSRGNSTKRGKYRETIFFSSTLAIIKIRQIKGTEYFSPFWNIWWSIKIACKTSHYGNMKLSTFDCKISACYQNLMLLSPHFKENTKHFWREILLTFPQDFQFCHYVILQWAKS